ncbi:DNA-binding response regulator [Candidatus Nomurabacteria bacterium RIFCSPLOWO2_01_FULL_42_17]|uniref:DNA-binding response regulator n=1 Tax=Candidatus Nomurabacteria bacterium RIFCSPLOWO2_01_FULL_42_17 TaxID=1801780 RepID=A0A1F6XMM0_9BACT|nr:MAG: DNA-binding response regulator [Candidatus Nomurabacteria bacterium RIFCSPLOWO2_01_FULL_42_17]
MAILIIEDEKKLVDILKRALKSERYSVDVAYDGETGLEKAMKNNYSLILLDIMLPKRDGFSVCKELRTHAIHTPIIMLTARGSTEDRVTGLDAGADDYLIKPFSTSELFARIRAVLRRRKTTESNIIKIGNLVMDKKKHEVTRAGITIPLTPKEYKLLDMLLSNSGEAISRQRLIEHAWGPTFKETNNELNVHIRYLRKKIDGKKDKHLIHTIRGVGFALKE